MFFLNKFTSDTVTFQYKFTSDTVTFQYFVVSLFQAWSLKFKSFLVFYGTFE